MNHVQQKLPEGDCGVAVLAIVTNTSYERVLQSVAPDAVTHGLWYSEMLHALLKITGKHWGVIDFTTDSAFKIQPTIRDYKFSDMPVILGIVRPDAGYIFHYIAIAEGQLHDPLLPDALPLESAKTGYHGDWIIQSVFRQF